MYTGATATARAMQAAFDLAEVACKALETAFASATVISLRSGTIAAAQRDPLNADSAELRRLVPEKMRAFSDSGFAMVEEWWALQRDTGLYWLYIGHSMTTGRLARPIDVLEFAERSSAHTARLASSAVDSAGAALAPLHKTAMANARRLANAR